MQRHTHESGKISIPLKFSLGGLIFLAIVLGAILYFTGNKTVREGVDGAAQAAREASESAGEAKEGIQQEMERRNQSIDDKKKAWGGGG